MFEGFYICGHVGMYPYDTTYSHTRDVSYISTYGTTAPAVPVAKLKSVNCFLRLLGAVVRLYRTGTRACSR